MVPAKPVVTYAGDDYGEDKGGNGNKNKKKSQTSPEARVLFKLTLRPHDAPRESPVGADARAAARGGVHANDSDGTSVGQDEPSSSGRWSDGGASSDVMIVRGSAKEVWGEVLWRLKVKMSELGRKSTDTNISGVEKFGFSPTMLPGKLVEGLPGAEQCAGYTFIASRPAKGKRARRKRAYLWPFKEPSHNHRYSAELSQLKKAFKKQFEAGKLTTANKLHTWLSEKRLPKLPGILCDVETMPKINVEAFPAIKGPEDQWCKEYIDRKAKDVKEEGKDPKRSLQKDLIDLARQNYPELCHEQYIDLIDLTVSPLLCEL